MFSDHTPSLCLFGAGGHGRVVGAIAANIWPTKIIFGDSQLKLGTLIDGIPVAISELKQAGDHDIIITVGNNKLRRRLQLHAEELGLNCSNLIADPENYFAHDLGDGSVILKSAVINVGARIGRGVIVNTGAVVEHDCTIKDFCHLAPNSVVLGGCTLEDGVWLGANATVLQNINVSANVTIGAGAVVVRDITEPGTYVGVPASQIA